MFIREGARAFVLSLENETEDFHSNKCQKDCKLS